MIESMTLVPKITSEPGYTFGDTQEEEEEEERHGKGTPKSCAQPRWPDSNLCLRERRW